MRLSIDDIGRLSPEVLRAAVPAWISTYVDTDAERRGRVADAVRAALEPIDLRDVAGLLANFVSAGSEYRLHEADPVARVIGRTYMDSILDPSVVEGLEHARAFDAAGGRRVVVCNHLSYCDTQVTDAMLVRVGAADLAGRLVAVAGPKVYTDPFRRLAALGLNTRKTAQSSAVATEQDSLSPRELAAIALQTLADCERLMDDGWVVLLYPEGTRSRTGRLGPFLRAAGRYLTIPGVRVLPLAQSGSDRVFPPGEPLMRCGAVHLRFGPAFDAGDHPGKLAALLEARGRVAALLPDAMRPADDAPELA